MTTKLSDLFYNTVIPFLPKNPNRWDTIRCYEFQTVDTGRAIRKTWVVWRDTSGGMTGQMPPDTIFLSARTDTIYKQSIQYTSKPDSTMLYPGANGKIKVLVDSYPVYYYEKKSAPLHRSDIIVDSFYITPANPTSGQWVKFSARIKNIGNDSLKASIADTVTFQVDGVTKKKYKASRGLGLPGSGKDTLTIAGSTNDWQALVGNHLFRAWIDMNDIYAELKEDNNVKYIWKNILNPLKNSIKEGNSLIPLFYFMNQSLPNPTPGKEVTIKYGLPKASPVSFVVYNVAGQMVWEYNLLSQKPGYYTLRWNLRDRFEKSLSSGIYFYRLDAGNWIQTRKMIIIK
jgi:archaellum component FlaG (FlaF/FlaG flagellin family)